MNVDDGDEVWHSVRPVARRRRLALQRISVVAPGRACHGRGAGRLGRHVHLEDVQWKVGRFHRRPRHGLDVDEAALVVCGDGGRVNVGLV